MASGAPIFANGAVSAAFSHLFNNETGRRGTRGSHKPNNDGYIELKEANWHYRNGKGAPLTADLSKINFSGISPSDFPKGPGTSEYFNLLNPENIGSVNDGLVYGSVKLTLGQGGTVTATYDTYDFDIKSWSTDTAFRNIETIMGNIVAGSGDKYRIYFYGVGKLGP